MNSCKRIVTNEDVMKYKKVVTKFLRDSVKKNWKDATLSQYEDEISLGNTGMTMRDMKQYLFTEVVVALQNYDASKNTKESTFVFTHLFNRIGQLMKRLTRDTKGYGIWCSQIEEVLGDVERD